jgi:hypothetical protein
MLVLEPYVCNVHAIHSAEADVKRTGAAMAAVAGPGKAELVTGPEGAISQPVLREG